MSGYDLHRKPAPHQPTNIYTYNKSTFESLDSSRDRLKEKEKLEKTSHLVDDLINSVKSLHTDIRRKSTELKLKEIEILRREEEAKKKAALASVECRGRRLSVSFVDDYSPRLRPRPHSACVVVHKTDSTESLSSSDYSGG